MLVQINAVSSEALEQRYREIAGVLQAANTVDSDGVVQLTGHRSADGDNGAFQDAGALPDDTGRPTAKEHFGYTDGIGDPYFKDSGSYPTYVAGGGKRVRNRPADGLSGWEPLATGEFLLGHIDEADEYPVAPVPTGLSKNGTFLVYRKLHENVASFDRLCEEQHPLLGDRELLAAKLVGRWRNGAPLTEFPQPEATPTHSSPSSIAPSAARRSSDPSTSATAKQRYYELKQRLAAFDFDDDIEGARCPVGAHIRRANPRSSLEFGVSGAFDTPGALVNRRRIARRGSPTARWWTAA